MNSSKFYGSLYISRVYPLREWAEAEENPLADPADKQRLSAEERVLFERLARRLRYRRACGRPACLRAWSVHWEIAECYTVAESVENAQKVGILLDRIAL